MTNERRQRAVENGLQLENGVDRKEMVVDELKVTTGVSLSVSVTIVIDRASCVCKPLCHEHVIRIRPNLRVFCGFPLFLPHSGQYSIYSRRK